MHTFRGLFTIFNFNSDFSGDVIVSDGRSGETMRVAGMDILKLVAEYVRRQRLARLEDMDWPELLGADHGDK